jgi:hypothetical protein
VGQLVDVTVILCLGLVYVVALTGKSVVAWLRSGLHVPRSPSPVASQTDAQSESVVTEK